MSSTDLQVRIIDALWKEIEDNANLPPHNSVLYRRPLAVFPEDCPLLTLWLQQRAFAPVTTNIYDAHTHIGITWQVASVERAQTLMDDPEGAKEQLNAIAAIDERMRYLSVHGWTASGGVVPEAYELYPLSTMYVPPIMMREGEIATGLVEGYSMTVQVSTTEES